MEKNQLADYRNELKSMEKNQLADYRNELISIKTQMHYLGNSSGDNELLKSILRLREKEIKNMIAKLLTEERMGGKKK